MRLTVREVAKLLKVSEPTVHTWIRTKGLPATHLNRQYRVNRTELLEWAAVHGIKIVREAMAHAPAKEAKPALSISLARALECGGVFHDVGGADKMSVLEEVIRRMPVPKNVERAALLKILLAREAMASTGVGEGIAIPHPRNPIVLHVSEPMITLCFLKNAVDYQSFDNRPVHTLFAMIAPNVRAHLQLLSRLAFAMHDPDFKELVSKKAALPEILEAAKRIDVKREAS